MAAVSATPLSSSTFLLVSKLVSHNPASTMSKIFIFYAALMAVTFVWFFTYYMKSKRFVKNVVLPPGPTPWPVVGYIPTLWRKKPRYRWILEVMKQFNTEIACIRLGKIHVIPVTSPELALEFLKTYDSCFASRPITVTTQMLSYGFLSAGVSPSGEQWKKMRRVLTSEILTLSRLRWMVDKRTEEADNLVRYIYRQTAFNNGGAVMNLRSVTQHFTGNMMRKMIFNKRYYGKGRDDGGPAVEEEEHIQALFTLLHHVYAFSVSDYMTSLKPFDFDGHVETVKKALSITRKYEEPIIDERVKEWRDGKRKKAEDMLDVFISLVDKDGNPLLSVREIKAQIAELLVATLDNPSNIGEWAMAELLNQPEIMQKAVEELNRVVGKKRLVQESDIPQLKYLMACAREALRLYPVAPFNLPHVAIFDVVVGGYFIPKGSQVLLSRIGLGRNPRVWEDPMRFDPERHLRDGTVERGLLEPNLRFISFTRGSRGCMGGGLGTNIIMMMLARLLQGFSWSLPTGKTKIDLSECDKLFLANPLHAFAKPRLLESLYLDFYRRS